jgi:hypothetical protein
MPIFGNLAGSVNSGPPSLAEPPRGPRRRFARRAPLLPALLAALLSPAHAAAEQAPAAAVVIGLAPGDLLNIRATASAVGTVNGRLPNGASVRSFGCDTVGGYQWCRIEQTGNPEVSGWAPARYLQAVDAEETVTGTLPAPADARQAAAAEADPRPGTESEAAPSLSQANLAARLGGGGAPLRDSASAIGQTAMRDAYGLAMAAQTVARAQPPSDALARDYDATGEIPCARYVGQPMTSCAAAIRRGGPDKAEVTVTWPDGGVRIIGFREGKPEGADAGGELRYTREGRLTMIRIGVSERFEITDALAFGN